MSATINRQMRVVTDTETAADDGLSVAAVRELADAMNNYKGLVSGQPLISLYSPEASLWPVDHATTTETLIHRFAPRPMPYGYDEIHFQMCAVMESGATGYCSFRLYASGRPYSGLVAPFDNHKLGGVWSVSSYINVTAASSACLAGVTDLDVVRNESGLIYLTLTGTKDETDETCEVYGIMATAKASV